ncbi:recombinase RecA [Candidatus Curtissbacteria bacterium RIFCSPHIGHO2_01_FULL_41_44]|uniref:Protein RecA n=1 Tax=Candidatus Curtissbacteria bacterium RIFCSPLOWO2_01_FULL_42_50 TaxID=1797730 RepID=A0A1F5H6S1_9BACT|nr:MAG: recombinase RecA [Candidatus Curtissbacteria bacterium RIFCSPHIGHO2_01_FULL_41_44]OGD93994.1 MAG: recombinase RecA [Candidatus Curtissbacteria bacterium RIFCSPHIGHO2_02_FULL_42_58]OGD97645.1 MAG: recombinase RecA [Candidatus Curtissbacteria bacterium RIFCSPHIGHO2_12_FULL_42_33]OGD99759.1 MAG: recombinase RecA [Candidatus Curtissbacteria bacterium RIFCSPLOWO2_01_FULL_42_50]OGE03860.1 MAG: recombinase RecA [Candidatus Curtissbacteria bacterium RIFCSPLOWO2_12_FULL_41_16]OGE11788.1 MAG: re
MTASDAKKQAILTAISQIEKAYGKGSIMKMGDSIGKLEVEVIPTGSVPVDLALGIGGLPRGRIIEIFGPEASGKTTLALSIIAQAQKNGGNAALIDAEHALDPLWAQKVGVNLDDLLISQPDTGEQGLEITETLIRSGAIDVVVIDSVAALVPRAEIEGEMGDSMMGVQARLMSQALRKLTGAISKSKTVAIFTNQLREKIGVMFGNPEVTPGGRALKFYSSVRLDIRKIDNIKDGDRVIGSRHRVKIVKNKVAPPFRIAELDIMGDEGISKEGGLLDVALELGLVTKSGAFFRWGAKLIGQGRESAKVYLAEHKKEAQALEKEIWSKVKKGLPTKPIKVTDAESEDEEILESISSEAPQA